MLFDINHYSAINSNFIQVGISEHRLQPTDHIPNLLINIKNFPNKGCAMVMFIDRIKNYTRLMSIGDCARNATAERFYKIGIRVDFKTSLRAEVITLLMVRFHSG